MNSKALCVVVLCGVLLAGCATRTLSLGQCAAIGAVLGGGGGAAVGNEVNNDWIGAGAAMGGVTGAAAGWLICKVIPEREVAEAPAPPEPQKETEPAPPPPVVKARIVLRGVNFAFDSAEIDEGSRVVLEVAAQTLIENAYVRVRVEGHTDSTGSAAYNQDLSRRRAEAVRDLLVEAGVESSRLEVVSFGEERPLASNDSAEGRRINRRVQLVTVD